MDLHSFITVCQEFRNMGDAVIDQLKAVVEDDSEECLSEQNSNALRRAATWLDLVGTYEIDAAEEARDLAERISAWVNDLPEPPRREV